MADLNEQQVTLQAALEKFKPHYARESFAILYSAIACQLARYCADGTITNHRNEKVDLTGVFELRLFNEKTELRWWHEAEGKERCQLLTNEILLQEAKAGTHEQQYLLWGESIGDSIKGWTQFAEARIGSFWVPVDGITAANKRRACFTATEYLREYQDGNVQVHDERLTGIKLYPLK